MNILVLGGTAFAGPYVVRQLVNEGHDVTVFHRGKQEPPLPETVQHIHGELRNLPDLADELRALQPEVVLHMLPGTAQEAWTAVRLFKGVARRIVAISSEDVYRAFNRLRGEESGPPDPIPLAEDAPLREKLFPFRSIDPFKTEDPDRRRWVEDYDKILVERIFMSEPDLPGTVLRLPAVYGPGDYRHRTFEYLKRMDDGRPAILLEDGLARWQWTRGYVENVASAIVLAVRRDRAKDRIYNVGEPFALSEEEWVTAIGQAAGWEGRILRVPRDQMPAHLRTNYDWRHHWVVDTSSIRQELGYAEHVSLEKSIRSAVEWERANPPDTIDSGQFDYDEEDKALEKLEPYTF